MREEPAKDAKARMLLLLLRSSSMKAKIHIHIHIHRSPAALARPVCGPTPVSPRIPPLFLRLGPLPTEIRAPFVVAVVVAVEPDERVFLAVVIVLPRC